MRTLFASVLFLFGLVSATAAACRPDVVELRGDWGNARFRVELAETAGERSQGLMYREEMAMGAGMLFVYPAPQARIAFWMRNTLIPLDMLFFDATGTLQKIHVNAVPGDETMIDGGTDIQYVLEINGGVARDLGITVGSLLRSPSIPAESAAWAC
ncbi:hypothetical protein ATO6_15535 [Oceanicola sp. 22II-s10i]|uniref:DUF192 domain-containing protein n=1 Tax=Oceanicola sp. 22II-s10i TaxID=1317116 RepID=UPI000B526E10|nr:DUF192 domain-containing protein [Oceanicola sp. 22II-s10i]OWU83835.1 hypothetical protein ATO6_15535 [Oceanicola sp. 22II-s10i]